jgi:hypothetical protein
VPGEVAHAHRELRALDDAADLEPRGPLLQLRARRGDHGVERFGGRGDA